jgi:CRISPR/Cas system type I-B associated protein Csh2 (Cas7 group RAMP superfamily)
MKRTPKKQRVFFTPGIETLQEALDKMKPNQLVNIVFIEDYRLDQFYPDIKVKDLKKYFKPELFNKKVFSTIDQEANIKWTDIRMMGNEKIEKYYKGILQFDAYGNIQLKRA